MRLHRHRFVVVKVHHFRDVTFGLPGEPATQVYKRCERCDKPKVERLRGTWNVEDLVPQPAEGGEG